MGSSLGLVLPPPPWGLPAGSSPFFGFWKRNCGCPLNTDPGEQHPPVILQKTALLPQGWPEGGLLCVPQGPLPGGPPVSQTPVPRVLSWDSRRERGPSGTSDLRLVSVSLPQWASGQLCASASALLGPYHGVSWVLNGIGGSGFGF